MEYIQNLSKLDEIYKLLLKKDYIKLKEYPTESINQVLSMRNLDYIKIDEVIKRDKQSIFRNMILKSFNYQCPISLNHQNICEACHILPYSNCKNDIEKYDVYNGILLDRNYHKLFDDNYFYISEIDCKIKINHNIPNEILEKYNLEDIEDKYIRELDNINSKIYLDKRNKIYNN